MKTKTPRASFLALVCVLTATHLMMGVFAAYLVHSLDKEYNRLVEPLVAAERTLDLVADAGAEIHRLVLNRLIEGDDGEMKVLRESLPRAKQKLESATSRFKTMTSDVSTDAFEVLETAARDYAAGAESVFALAEANQRAEALDMRRTVLRPLRENYVRAVNGAAEAVREKIVAAKTSLSLRSRGREAFLLTLSLWPVAALLFVLAIAAWFIASARGLSVARE